MDIIPALDKPTAQEPLKVAGNNRKLNFQSSIVRLYFCEKNVGKMFISPVLFAVIR